MNVSIAILNLVSLFLYCIFVYGTYETWHEVQTPVCPVSYSPNRWLHISTFVNHHNSNPYPMHTWKISEQLVDVLQFILFLLGSYVATKPGRLSVALTHRESIGRPNPLPSTLCLSLSIRLQWLIGFCLTIVIFFKHSYFSSKASITNHQASADMLTIILSTAFHWGYF